MTITLRPGPDGYYRFVEVIHKERDWRDAVERLRADIFRVGLKPWEGEYDLRPLGDANNPMGDFAHLFWTMKAKK